MPCGSTISTNQQETKQTNKSQLVTLLLFAGCMLLANAQNFQRGDTLLMGQRWPTYYYWGDNWFDSKYDPANKGGIGTKNFGAQCKPEIARYIYADSSLRVIGIAVAYEIYYGEFYKLND